MRDNVAVFDQTQQINPSILIFSFVALILLSHIIGYQFLNFIYTFNSNGLCCRDLFRFCIIVVKYLMNSVLFIRLDLLLLLRIPALYCQALQLYQHIIGYNTNYWLHRRYVLLQGEIEISKHYGLNIFQGNQARFCRLCAWIRHHSQADYTNLSTLECNLRNQKLW